MNIARSLTAIAVVLLLGPTAPSLIGATGEGVVLAVIYDTSGSMLDPVQDADGKEAPKFEIANRALLKLTDQVQAFAATKPESGSRSVQAGLFTFKGPNAGIALGEFDAEAFRRFGRNFRNPGGNTPLGSTLTTAVQAVLKNPVARKHVLVITDGENTAGPQPAAVLPRLKQQAQQQQTVVSVHFIAFDIDAKHFGPLKKQGVTVVSAADEKQLNAQLDFILQKKILLEDEDPKP